MYDPSVIFGKHVKLTKDNLCKAVSLINKLQCSAWSDYTKAWVMALWINEVYPSPMEWGTSPFWAHHLSDVLRKVGPENVTEEYAKILIPWYVAARKEYYTSLAAARQVFENETGVPLK